MLMMDSVMCCPFATTLNKSCSNFILLRMAIEREHAQLVDLDSALETHYDRCHLRPPKSFLVGLSDVFTIECCFRLVAKGLDVLAVEAVIWPHLSVVFRCPPQSDGTRLATLGVQGKVFDVWEQYSPQEIECDFTMLQKGVDTRENRRVFGLDEIKEQCELIDCIRLPLFLLDGLLLELFEMLAECGIESDEDLGI